MSPDVLDEWGSPGRDRNSINQGQGIVVAAVQQVSPQRCGPTEIMRRDIGFLEVPMLQERREHLTLGPEGDILPVPHLRLAVAEQVEDENRSAARQQGSDPPPDGG
jgi:hypothetical protein